MGIFSDNPVLQREVKGRIRLRRVSENKPLAWAAGILVLVILFFYVRGLIALWRGTEQDARDFYGLVVYSLLFLIVLLAPALSATAITQEREQQTWEALATTRLTGSEILLGKWVARQTLLAALGLILLPLLLGASLRGGLGIGETVIVMLFLAMTTGLFSLLGLFCSFRARRTAAATASALALSAFLCVGTLMIEGLLQTFFRTSGYWAGNGETTSAALWLNPFWAMNALLSILGPQNNYTPGQDWSSEVSGYVAFVAGTMTFCLFYMITRYRRAVQER